MAGGVGRHTGPCIQQHALLPSDKHVFFTCWTADRDACFASIRSTHTMAPTPSLITRRAKLYTKDALNDAKQAFLDHFKLEGTTPPTDLTSSTVRIALSSIKEVELKLVRRYQEDVRGIHFAFGLKDDAFHPVVRFMYANYSAKGDLELFPEHYELEKEQLVKIDKTSADVYTDAYASRILIDRLRDGNFTVLDINIDEPDPKAEWFPYADNVNKLIGDNSAGRYLVVNCIAVELNYTTLGFAPAPAPEMRQLLVLFMATDTTDLLDNKEPTLLSGYRDLALDLGYLCPPRCK